MTSARASIYNAVIVIALCPGWALLINQYNMIMLPTLVITSFYICIELHNFMDFSEI